MNRPTIPGLLLTGIALVFALWSGHRLMNFGDWPPAVSAQERQAYEETAFQRMQQIVAAQKAYITQDYTGEGKQYAAFLPHLWVSINERNEKVEVNLLPQQLALAIGHSTELDGYYYVDLYELQMDEGEEPVVISHKHNWAVAAAPSHFGQTGTIVFVADKSGKILARKTTVVPKRYPFRPAETGWTEIRSVEDIAGLR